jgi:hypothetical protein
MAHFLFLLVGDSEVMPGFNTAMSALRDLVGFELMWSGEDGRGEGGRNTEGGDRLNGTNDARLNRSDVGAGVKARAEGKTRFLPRGHALAPHVCRWIES